ncbi:MAG: hypothetical protein P4L51_23085 [Puia sp.]|nr:hypothetical protein [Puia sp.]
MKESRIEGKVSFVNHDKQYVTIEFMAGGRKKKVNGKIDEATQAQWIAGKLVKKIHRFHEGDEVQFTVARSARGEKDIAEGIVFRFNNALSNLIARAAVDNQFTGYLKAVDDGYFVKETGTYLFFPLLLSPWELPPAESQLNEPVSFKLENTGNPEKTAASLLKPRYIPEYLTAKKYYTNKTVIEARVARVTPHGIQVYVIGDKIMGKIALETKAEEGGEAANDHPAPLPVKDNELIKVVITHLSPTRIVLSRV